MRMLWAPARTIITVTAGCSQTRAPAKNNNPEKKHPSQAKRASSGGGLTQTVITGTNPGCCASRPPHHVSDDQVWSCWCCATGSNEQEDGPPLCLYYHPPPWSVRDLPGLHVVRGGRMQQQHRRARPLRGSGCKVLNSALFPSPSLSPQRQGLLIWLWSCWSHYWDFFSLRLRHRKETLVSVSLLVFTCPALL